MSERKNIFFYYKEDPKIHSEIENLKNQLTHYGFNMVNHAENANIIASIGERRGFPTMYSSHWFPR